MAGLGDAIAAAVRRERAGLKLTQRQLGERLGVSGDVVSDIETGRHRITADDIPGLCIALEVTFAELVRRADPEDRAAMGL
jgi:transcriptional regulator with XRE-family HTH domain